MVAKTLQWIGLVSIVSVLAVGIGSLALVKDRVNIVIQDSEAAAAPDPLALVKDDLAQLHTDLDAIAQALDGSLREIGGVLGRQAEEQERLSAAFGKLGKTMARPASNGTVEALASISRQLVVLQGRIDSLQGRPPSVQRPSAGTPPSETPVAKTPVAEPPVAVVDPKSAKAETPTKGDPKLESPAGAEPKKKPSFLSFRLPSRSFRFDVRQRFRILGSLSRVGFDAKSKLHDFSGVTSKVDGEFVANLASATPAWSGTIRADAASLRTGVEDRDAGMFERLEVKKHKSVEFEILGFRIAEQGLELPDQQVRGTIRGRMTIRGKAREVSMPVEISVDASRRVAIKGQMALALTDYGVDVPNQLGLVTMEDEVKVWVALRARSVGLVSK